MIIMNTVCCIKYGTKYGPEYVNNLFGMLKKNLTLPFQFVCFTDNYCGIQKEIITRQLIESKFKGWWQKIAYFKPPFPIENAETVLCLDLDIIIINNIDYFFTCHDPGDFCSLADYFPQNGNNSSFIRFHAKNPKNNLSHIYDKMISFPEKIYERNTGEDPKFRPKNAGSKYWGDQIWITEHTKDFVKLFDKSYIKSYRLEYLKNPNNIKNSTKIVLFHGNPKPHEVVKNNSFLRSCWEQ